MKIIGGLLIITQIFVTLPHACFAETPETTPPFDVLAKQYPDARVYRITPEEYSRIEPLIRNRIAQGTARCIQLAQISPAAVTPADGASTSLPTPNVVSNNLAPISTNREVGTTVGPLHTTPPTPPEMAPPRSSVCGENENQSQQPYTPVNYEQAPTRHEQTANYHGFVELVADLGSSNWSGNDLAIVIFVVVTVTVVLAVVVYAGAFLYEALTGTGSNSYWWDLEAHSAFLGGSGTRGNMSGAKFSSGLENSEARVGLVLEGGYLRADIHPEDKGDPCEIRGIFAMAGAGIRWPFGIMDSNPSFFGMEFLAGTADDDNVDLISVARANVDFGIGSRVRLGFSLGALYMGLTAKEGLIENANNYSTLIGVQTGYRL